ncbi:dipeptidase [Sphingomonas sp. 8AM]|uniref:dipeptidase n=1 Tax=Sphingomonas sp. 8AM TaxID=2653170 RepID=UPI0012F0087E|nr:dipeptidase [Sphingomonas sp. 8AM]VXC98957.1 Membrane dipeptidase [Sphingomonas sp. 8AM]
MRAMLLAAGALLVALPASADAQDDAARVARVLKATPLIDGHNDWPEALREREGEARWTTDLRDLGARTPAYNTDIARLRRGKVGAQFWSVWVSPTLPGKEQVEQTLEQIDLVRSLPERYPDTFALARTAADVRRAHAAGRIACLIGVEGGGQIDGSLSVLRSYAALGAGYLTLTHSLTIDWADSATDDPRHGGLTDFGRKVVLELNRLGMLVDLSHVSEKVMRDALAVTRAPVIFSHSGARALNDHPRNVADDVLRLVARNGGVVMVDYSPPYVSDAYRRWSADSLAEKARLNSPPYNGLDIGQPEKAARDYASWLATHPAPTVTLAQVADHVDHIARVAGVDHVGLGSDFDGVGETLPQGLTDVSTYPALLAELMRRGWSDAAVAKLAGGNVLRVMEAAERVKARRRETSQGAAVAASRP